MTFYAPRNIGPADQVLFDADGNAVGIQAAGSSSQPVLGFSPTKHAAIDSLVSTDGNVTAAALPTLTGIPGQLVRLSDGDDDGALLVWAIPEDSASYAWCWQIWPRASYF